MGFNVALSSNFLNTPWTGFYINLHVLCHILSNDKLLSIPRCPTLSWQASRACDQYSLGSTNCILSSCKFISKYFLYSNPCLQISLFLYLNICFANSDEKSIFTRTSFHSFYDLTYNHIISLLLLPLLSSLFFWNYLRAFHTISLGFPLKSVQSLSWEDFNNALTTGLSNS